MIQTKPISNLPSPQIFGVMQQKLNQKAIGQIRLVRMPPQQHLQFQVALFLEQLALPQLQHNK